VQGHVKQGTPVTVEYLVTESGKNLAVSVTANA
jgi:DNA-binding HxlR family transcriptional regulator